MKALDNEIWKPIGGYEGLYEVSNKGRVRSFHNATCKTKDKDGILRQFKGTYYSVSLHKDKKQKTHDVHRLVADAFLPNPNNLPEVNHKNEDKLDNRVENLEWVTHKYNIAYSHNIEKSHIKQRKKTEAFDKDGNSIGVFESARAMCRILGLRQGQVACVLIGKGKTVKGLTFKYV